MTFLFQGYFQIIRTFGCSKRRTWQKLDMHQLRNALCGIYPILLPLYMCAPKFWRATQAHWQLADIHLCLLCEMQRNSSLGQMYTSSWCRSIQTRWLQCARYSAAAIHQVSTSTAYSLITYI